MRIRHLSIRNFRGIRNLRWAPSAGMNCLIGPGDSTKTTILDAIETVLNPRSYYIADDSDFYNLDVENALTITVTIGDLPDDFLAENKYGLYLRGWDIANSVLHDEPAEKLEEVLSIRLTIDRSLEAQWSIFNNRIAEANADPPRVRYKDMLRIATSRLGPYAERHLSWGRQSVLNQIDESQENVSLRLAEAGRAARRAFKASREEVFKDTADRVQRLGRDFSVPLIDRYKAELDVQAVSVTTGGIALHDGALPLRCLGTGSSRLLVSALQHDAASGSHIALIDEVEYGLEPHRIARLLRFLRTPQHDSGDTPQMFLTTHSPIVIRELEASDLFTIRSVGGAVEVTGAASVSDSGHKIQAHLRASPEAFLARRVFVGEGRTEAGLLRGLDTWWTANGQPSLAFRGVVPIHGDGKDSGPEIAESLLDLGYEVALLLDSDEPPNAVTLDRVCGKGGVVIQWDCQCSTEDRLFADLPWDGLRDVIAYLADELGADSILAHINNALAQRSNVGITDLSLPESLNTPDFRATLGIAAVARKGQKRPSWLKNMGRAEAIGEKLGAMLGRIPEKPLATSITNVRQWIDAS